MVLDTSAIVAILRDEPECAEFVRLLATADDPLISAATLLESSIVLHAKAGDDGVGDLDHLLQAAGVRCVAVDAAQAVAARTAWDRYGKRRSPAALNYGDLFSYALATTLDRALLYKGDDFSKTGIRSART
jgi:ribonuclease VapC